MNNDLKDKQLWNSSSSKKLDLISRLLVDIKALAKNIYLSSKKQNKTKQKITLKALSWSTTEHSWNHLQSSMNHLRDLNHDSYCNNLVSLPGSIKYFINLN